MQLLNDICNETGLTIDDARIVLMDVREDWATTDSVTDGEANLIKQATQSALPLLDKSTDSKEIQPVADMPIEKQQTLIDNVSQILGHQMVLSVQRRIEMVDAIEKLTNQVILSNRETNQKQLAAQIAQQDDAIKAQLMQAINTLQGLVNSPVETPKTVDDSDFYNAIRACASALPIASVQKKMQR